MHMSMRIITCLAIFAASATCAYSQYYHHAQHGSATTRHCQTDYDHRPHYYHSRSHFHYCPGGAHIHDGGHSHGGKSYRADYDPLVAQAQKILFEKGMYDHDHGQVDGIFGRETKDALHHFQKNSGLALTGVFDDATLKALGIEPVTYGAPGGTSGGGNVLTPTEAAAILKVSEPSVISLLESGELAGKKIGSEWRIARSALEEYLRK